MFAAAKFLKQPTKRVFQFLMKPRVESFARSMSIWDGKFKIEKQAKQILAVKNSAKLELVHFYVKKAPAKKPDPVKAFKEHCIVPEIIDCPPKNIVEICYPSGVGVELGSKLTPTNVKDEPIKVDYHADAKSFYTILMIDPDAPCRDNPEFRHWIHWMVVNIPGCDLCNGQTIAEYVGAGPPQDTGLHRYVFLVYKQQCRMSFKEKKRSNKTADARPNFDLDEFVEEYELGQPIAGNFFLAEYDEYVPILYHQLKVK